MMVSSRTPGVLIERAGKSGFDMTHCETHIDLVREMISQFERLFAESHAEMVLSHPPDGKVAAQLRAFFQEAEFSSAAR